MRTRDDILTEVDYLQLITEDCALASQRIRDAHASLQLGLPLLLSSMSAPETKGLALEVTFEELTQAQKACHRLVRLIEGRLRMLDAEVSE